MYKHWIPLSWLALLSACSSPPQPLTPDGSHRIPANSPQAIEHYRNQQLPASSTQAAQQRIASLERELHDLRLQLATAAADAVPASANSNTAGNATQVEISSDSVVFRMPQPFGKVQCRPGPALELLLLRIAPFSQRIAVRAHTDAPQADRANRKVATQRAQCARQLLLDAGVDPARIHTTAHAAGAFIADNRGATGKARNRRIEIELQGIDHIVLTQLASVTARSTP